MKRLFSLLLLLPLLAGCAAAPAALEPNPEQQSEPPSPSPSVVVPDIPISDGSLKSLAAVTVVQPVRIVLPELSIDMTVEAEGLDQNGAMALPDNASTAGWYQFGPGMNSDMGATVIAAHIDSRHDGIGPFSRLKDAAMGSTITVAGSDGTSLEYTVTEMRSVGKIDAPMAEVFDRSGPPRLVLVTCGGTFDSRTGHYLDNILLTATPRAG